MDKDWLIFSCVSAIFLGIYDLLKKISLKDNPVPPVLFFSVVSGSLIWIPFIGCSLLTSDAVSFFGIEVHSLSSTNHFRIVLKSALVGSSWIFAYMGVKHLPVSISGPIRATAPLWTILLAVMFIGERPLFMQWIGVLIILISFYTFSLMGKLEGIHFHRDKWVGCMIIATLLGALSALYDKWLLQTIGIGTFTLQAWFSIYLVVVLCPLYILWIRRKESFTWKWSIAGIGIFLLLADAFYFVAVKDPEALISVISPVRRSSVFISFIGAVILFKEKNFNKKFWLIILLMVGILLINMS